MFLFYLILYFESSIFVEHAECLHEKKNLMTFLVFYFDRMKIKGVK